MKAFVQYDVQFKPLSLLVAPATKDIPLRISMLYLDTWKFQGMERKNEIKPKPQVGGR